MKKLTLSFDNGPDPECTPQVLTILAERDIKASFFVCAKGNTVHPALSATTPEALAVLEEVQRQGHWIGNHTLTHTLELGTTNDIEAIEREIGSAQEMLGDFVSEHRFFRPYMGGGFLNERCFGPEAVKYLCDNNYTSVLFNCVPRDWEIPETWPEQTFEEGKDLDWMLLITHDVALTGAMKQLPRFLDKCIDDGIEIVQEFPPDCTPILNGELVGSLSGLLCGDTPLAPSEHAVTSH